MTSIADGSVKIQTTSEVNFSTPAWFGARGADQQVSTPRTVSASLINEQVRFARKRFGRYKLIDFLAVLAGLRGETASAPMAGVLRATPAVRRPLHGRSGTVTS
jgi:hypothetical protein